MKIANKKQIIGRGSIIKNINAWTEEKTVP